MYLYILKKESRAMMMDGIEYDILERAVAKTAGLDGLTCEIGVRRGGSSILMMQTLESLGDKSPHVGLDPYGDIPYFVYNNDHRPVHLDYTNHMRNDAMVDLFTYVGKTRREFVFFNMEDTEFFARFADGVPIYTNGQKRIIGQYKCVFFDGPHTTKLVRSEFAFFHPRMVRGGTLVFDDIDQYPHMAELDEYIRACGYDVIEKGARKIAYVKL